MLALAVAVRDPGDVLAVAGADPCPLFPEALTLHLRLQRFLSSPFVFSLPGNSPGSIARPYKISS